MKKIHGSSSGWMWGSLVITQYASGCLRSILLGANGIRDTIDPKHAERGLQYENEYAGQYPNLEREKVIFHPISPYVDTYYSSRCDFYKPADDLAERRVVELKSSESRSVYSDVIKHGNYKINNLAQLVSYMVSLETPNGTLSYGYFERDKKDPKVLIKRSERVFDVKIGDDGSVHVDHQPTQFKAQDQLDHRHAACDVLNENLVWARPYNWNAGWDSPCRMCPFKKTCDKYDRSSMTTNEFIEDARNNLVKAN